MSDTVVVAPTIEPSGFPAPSTPASPDTPITPQSVRDASGRFAPKAPVETPAAPPPAKFNNELMGLAKEAFYSEEEINSFPSAAILYDAVQGRKAAMAAQRAQNGNGYVPAPSAAPPAPQPQKLPAIDLPDFNIEIPEDASEEYAKPLKEVAGYVNQVKAAFVQQLATRDQQIANLQAQVQQQSAVSQQAAQSQQVQFFDSIASTVPGLVEALGKPSQNLASHSPNYSAWGELAPIAAARAQAQGVPEQFVDWNRAFGEAWTAYRAFKGNGQTNGQSNGHNANGLPGMAPRSAPRHTSMGIVPKENMTKEEEFNFRLQNVERMFQANGGMNPLLL